MSDRLLANQLAHAMLLFYQKFENLGAKVIDDVTDEPATLGEIFSLESGVWVMRPDSLPGDVNIKAIGVTKRGILIETSPLDWTAFQAACVEDRAPFRVRESRRQIYYTFPGSPYSKGVRALFELTPPKRPPKRSGHTEDYEMGERVLWRMLIREWRLNDTQVRMGIEAANLAFIHSCFKESAAPKVETTTTGTGPAPMKMRLEMRQQMHLAIEQVPGLVLGLQTRQELRGMLLVQNAQRLNRMEPAAAEEYVGMVAGTLGEETARNLVVYALAAKIKRAHTELSWKDARLNARRVVRGEVAVKVG